MRACKHIFYTNQILEGSSADCSLFILSLHTYVSAVKILLKIFLYEDLARYYYIHLSVVFPSRMPAGPALLRQYY